MCLEINWLSSCFRGFQGIILDDQVFFPRLYRGDRHFGRSAAETRNPRVLTGRLDSGSPPSLPIIKTPRRAKAPILFRMPQNWPAPPGMTAEGRAGVPGNHLFVFRFPGFQGIILDDQVFFPRLYRGDRHFGRGAAETRNPRVLTGRLDSGSPPSLPIIKTPRRAKAPILFRMPQELARSARNDGRGARRCAWKPSVRLQVSRDFRA